jgi:uncharacterized protein (DUF58 family)
MSRARELALAGALMCAAAVLFALPALLVPGLALLLAGALAPAWVFLSAARAGVTLRTAVTSAYEGESVAVTVTVRRGALAFPAAELVPLPGAPAVPLPARGRGELELSAIAPRRGRHTLGPARLRLSDPLGVCAHELVSGEQELLVLPRVYPVSAPALDRLGGRGAAASRTPRHTGAELEGLRPYLPGTAASRIHWPTVARTGTLLERGFLAESERRPLVVLDADAPASEQALDLALRATASLCVHLARRGGCLLLLPGERRAAAIAADLRGWPVLHARLALVRAGATGTARRPPSRHASLYVTAADAVAPPVHGPCYRVGPHPLAGLGVAFTVAGCSAQLIGAGAA